MSCIRGLLRPFYEAPGRAETTSKGLGSERVIELIIGQARQLRGTPYKLGAKDPVAQGKIDCSGLLSYIGNKLGIMDKKHMYSYNAWLLYSLGKRKTFGEVVKGDVIFFLAQNKGVDNHIVIALGGPVKLDEEWRRIEVIDASFQHGVANRYIDIKKVGEEWFYYTTYDGKEYKYKLRFATNPIIEYGKYKNVDFDKIADTHQPPKEEPKTAVVEKQQPKQQVSSTTKPKQVLRYSASGKPICQTYAVPRKLSEFEEWQDFHVTQYIPGNGDPINCGGSCNVTANGTKLSPDDGMAGKLAACPRQFPFGTKIEVEGYGVVTCVDRGGLITLKGDINSRCNESSMNRLDIYTGYGKQIAPTPPRNTRARIVK